nr:cleavage and polyadenylation specificity factor subunit 6 [Ipomoea trifida]GMD95483.1 cleavage and polyadenylation specificity factor subunit 6 [Ipomoea batatas]GMD96835.1 cleavage and polyadenylation specificity factor subunit 6 [Ipomoea batatas]GMD97889.1 cleavage and polyadenylation specificity factor subunit 6 [Ipomoea batatas]GMD98887.1 cleavage and polyadenylation specificity factor subunit 6 [Ipomoea batatas]
MDPTADDQLDFDDEEYGGGQKMQYHGGGTIPALAEEEMMGEDDEYDDLYNDVNVGEGFLQLQRSEAPKPPDTVVNGGSQAPENNMSEPRAGAITSQEMNPGVASSGLRFPEQKSGLTAERGPNQAADAPEKARPPSMTRDPQVGNMGFQGSVPMSHRTGSDPADISGNAVNESMPLQNSAAGGSRGAPLMPAHQMNSNANINMNSSMMNENQMRPAIENGNTMLFVGELHWWTTDADLESVLIQYGKVKEIKFFDERASGKSKGYCQVEFYDPSAAAACKEGMNGHLFNGRACVVAFASPQTIKQMGVSYMNKTQNQVQAQPRRPMNEGLNRGSGTSFPSGDQGRNFGRGGWGRGGQGMPNRGPGGGPARGRGAMGAKNMVGNVPGANANMSGGAYGQGIAGPGFGGPPGLMHPQGMMGPGFDPGYMGRGAGYGGFSGPGFPGMLPPFPAVNPMGLAGVAPHVNPAFFGRGMAANGMGMMGTTGMDGPHPGMWTDTSTGGWGGEEHERRTRESSYGGEDNASEYGYGEASHDKGARSTAASREKERASERDWSGNSEKRHRDDREYERDRYDREHRYRDERDGYRDYRHKERELDYEDDYDRGHSSRSRSRSRAVQEEDHRSRSRDTDYGKRKRLPSE